ncbi:methyltransferase domain-containing protein [Micromonospora sp. CA-244673]|uniref:methyltransferase domain-containing protein n=1 Tax=Micromonospora sp. CA-244673 TaxID=3239958 RepID=UPI003D8CD3AE
MAMIAYDEASAAAFAATRHVPSGGLASWRAAVARHLPVGPGDRVLDLGAGTGAWAAAFRAWWGVDVVAVEPAAADGLRRAAHTPLVLLDDADYDRGLRRLRAAARRTPHAPVVDALDLLVLR